MLFFFSSEDFVSITLTTPMIHSTVNSLSEIFTTGYPTGYLTAYPTGYLTVYPIGYLVGYSVGYPVGCPV